jgi:GYF domain 2
MGPVTFGDLQIKAKDSGLNPRLDMVWTQGMAEWKLSGEIDGLFDRSAAVVAKESIAEPASPYQPPQHRSTAEQTALHGDWPGARRRTFLITIFVLPALLHFGIANIIATFGDQFGHELSEWILLGVMILTGILFIYTSLQRLVNVGMSRWWYLGNFVPFLNLWVGFRCFACPSGYAYHKKLDGAGMLLAIVYWLALVVSVFAIVAILAVFAGAIGTPGIRQQIQEALRTMTAVKP